MAALRFTRTAHDRIRWPTLAAALGNVPTAAWTTAMVVRRASLTAATYQTHSYLLSGSGNGTSEVGTGFSPTGSPGENAFVFTTGTNSFALTKSFNNTSDTWGIVISKATGSATPRLGWVNLSTGGAMTYENFNLAQGNRSAATMLEIGAWQNTSDWTDAWMGVVGWWNVGLMSDANMAALFANKKTSDMYASAAGTPVFLTELNITPANVVDLIGNATGTILLGASGPTLDASETLAGWSFDGAGLSGFYDGKLDEAALYNRKLTIDEHIARWTTGGGTLVFHLSQVAFQGRNDDGTEATASPRTAQNSNWSQLRDVNIRVRFEVQEVGGLGGASTAQLQYSKNGGAFANVTAASSNVRASASSLVADGAATTDQLTAGTGTFAAGSFDEVDGAVASVTLPALGHTEIEFCVQIRSADVAVGDTIDLRLTFGGDASPVYSQSPSLLVQGALTTLTQKAFRLRNDDGDETSATWKATQNTNASAFLDTNLRVRFQIQETAAGSGVVAYQLQYNKNVAGWLDVTSSALCVRPSASTNVFDDAILTEQLSGGTGTYVAGRFDEADAIASGNPLVASAHTEIEFCVQLRSADVLDADTVQLRIVPSGDVTGATTYTQTPTVTAVGSPPPTISGFVPASGQEGAASVVITGTHFTGASAVRFNGAGSSFLVDNDLQITATCPLGATTGKITVTTPNGTATSATDFTVVTAPPPPPPPPPSASTGSRDASWGGEGGGTSSTILTGTTPAARDSHWGGR